jgi:phosphoribosylformimino-5-aminoimidazole carboxamide ribotide isomerase
VILYPAIDLRDGRCVRLIEGDFDRETRYDADPAAAARRWVDAGAQWLHVVDLDGAVAGKPVNFVPISHIRESVDVPIQLGGGLRRIADIEAAFAAGINRAVLGTAALREPELASAAIARWGDGIAIALDTRDGLLATDGWLGQTTTSPIDAARDLAERGGRHFIFTDIRRDGTMRGPNLAGLRALTSAIDAEIIASGGIATLEDIRDAREAGAKGAIIGRALYDGRIDLTEAIAIAASLEQRR